MSLNNANMQSNDSKTQCGDLPQPALQRGLGSNLSQSVILDYVTRTLKSAPSFDKSNCDVKQLVDSKAAASNSATSATVVKSNKLAAMVGAKVRKGMKPMRITLPYSVNMANSGSAGILNAVLAVDPTASPEFASCAALYDEYRVESGRFLFQVNQSSSSGSPDTLLVLGYDPTDASVLTSTREGCELTRHKLFALSPVGAIQAVYENAKPLEFDFSVHPTESISLSATGTVTALPGAWRSTDATLTPQTNGWIKSYWLNAGAASASAILAIFYVTLSFRSRK